jgi:hypothetical protein
MNNRILELARQVWPDPSTSHINHEKFAKLTVEDCIQTLINHGYTDAASVLKEAHFGAEPEWQVYKFPEI